MEGGREWEEKGGGEALQREGRCWNFSSPGEEMTEKARRERGEMN